MTIRDMPFKKMALALPAGSLTFWLLIFAARLILGEGWMPILIPLTLTLPLLMCFALEMFCDLSGTARQPIGICMLAGVWASGPFWMTSILTLTPSEGFHAKGSVVDLLWETALFPAVTFLMSTYEGELFALLLTTVAVVVFSTANFRFFKLNQRLR